MWLECRAGVRYLPYIDGPIVSRRKANAPAGSLVGASCRYRDGELAAENKM